MQFNVCGETFSAFYLFFLRFSKWLSPNVPKTYLICFVNKNLSAPFQCENVEFVVDFERKKIEVNKIPKSVPF